MRLIGRAILLTLKGWTSARIAEVFRAREDTVRFWRSEFARGGVEATKASVYAGPPPLKTAAALRVCVPLLEAPVADRPNWTIPRLSAGIKRAILHALVERADVRPETVEFSVRPSVLPNVMKPDLDIRRLPINPDGPARVLSVPARLRRTGMETRLMIPGASGSEPIRAPDRSLLRLIDLARRKRMQLGTAMSLQKLLTSGAIRLGSALTPPLEKVLA